MGLRLQQQFMAPSNISLCAIWREVASLAVPTIPGYTDHGVNCGRRNRPLHAVYFSVKTILELALTCRHDSDSYHGELLMISDTIPASIALLRLDTDWYSSTKHEIEHLHPNFLRKVS
jgi:hypothetical protein